MSQSRNISRTSLRVSRFALVSILVLSVSFTVIVSLIISYLPILERTQGLFLSIAVSLAAGSITFAGIVFSYYLREESSLLVSMKMFLNNCIWHLEEWRTALQRSEQSKQMLYDNARKHWIDRLSKIHLVGKWVLLLAFLPFMFLVLSIFALLIFLNFSNSTLMAIGLSALFLGVAFLFLDITSLILNSLNIQSLKSFFGEGELWISRIGRKRFKEPAKEILYEVPPTRRRIDAELRFKGRIRNGFFHVVLDSGVQKKAVPDPATYFQDVSYSSDLKVIVDPEYDTGVLQGECSFEDTLTVMSLNLSMISGDFHSFELHGYARNIVAGIYEDPVDLPSQEPKRAKFAPTELPRERHCIDRVLIKLKYKRKRTLD